ncbi:MAG: dipeptide epimerase [Gammaproteobacteria bacterium]|nr:dipeptide epimerase [Gammaproteobacteria bacterium]MDP6146510.1 dipeptide epimerase [Gammaproteobacteria bacterium]|tara:strand:+ start:3338 stop:4393 length:1056 start_codon:yes stop_codon:yes gene_type:complete
MIITDAKVETHDMQLKEPWAIAGHVHESIKNTFITLKDTEGNIGIGSCATQNDSEESVKACFDNLNSFSSSLTGKDLTPNENILSWVASELSSSPEGNAAVDIALHDLWAKRQKKSLVEALGKKHQSFDTSITIGVASLEKTIEMAEKHIGNGFSFLKIKIGDCVEEDIERMKALFALKPEEIRIRVDANRGYSKEELIKFYGETLDLGLELIEQPMETDQNDEMLYFPEEIRKICVADESLKNFDHAMHLVQEPKPFGVFNIKLMKCGGVFAAKKIAALAQENGIKLMWGCFDESKVSISAALHTALSCENTQYIDLDGFFDLGWDLIEGGYTCENGVMSVIEKPGLGIY